MQFTLNFHIFSYPLIIADIIQYENAFQISTIKNTNQIIEYKLTIYIFSIVRKTQKNSHTMGGLTLFNIY